MLDQIFASQTIGFSDLPTVLFSMLLAAVFGFLISWIYRRNYRGVMYSGNFSFTLIMMTLVTTPVVLCIQHSLALSMGMVGALSIVRFRTAVKEPLDSAYVFWALTTGILLGAGQFLLAAVALLMIAILLTAMVNIQTKSISSYLLVVRMSAEAERAVAQVVGGIRIQKLKSKTASAAGVEATYEVRVDKPDALLSKIQSIQGVRDATLVAYMGEAA